jgi:hypothetical protein
MGKVALYYNLVKNSYLSERITASVSQGLAESELLGMPHKSMCRVMIRSSDIGEELDLGYLTAFLA